jgi:hypothetical protein
VTEGIAYCEEHDLTAYNGGLQLERSRLLVQTGRWDEASELCAELLAKTRRPPSLVSVLARLAVIRARRGQPGAWDYLDQALAIANDAREPSLQLIAQLARAEACWLDGDADAARREAELAFRSGPDPDAWTAGALAAWLRRTGSARQVSQDLAEPYRLELAGDAEAAAEAWGRLGCPYDAALALADATAEDSLRDALRIATDVGATALGRIVSERLG